MSPILMSGLWAVGGGCSEQNLLTSMIDFDDKQHDVSSKSYNVDTVDTDNADNIETIEHQPLDSSDELNDLTAGQDSHTPIEMNHDTLVNESGRQPNDPLLYVKSSGTSWPDHSLIEPVDESQPFILPSGTWISNTPTAQCYESVDSINTTVNKTLSLGTNAIYPVIWNKQQFFVDSSTVAEILDPSFISLTEDNQDVLAVLIDAARSHNLGIYPSLESGLKVVMRQQGRTTKTLIGEMVSQRDHWLSLDRNGEVIEMCHFDVCFAYLNPLNPEVINFLTGLATEILANYDVDGLIYDDHFSLPAPLLGCDPLVSLDPSLARQYDDWLAERSLWDSLLTDNQCIKFSNLIKTQAIIDHFKVVSSIAHQYNKKILLSPAGIPSWSKREWLQDWESMAVAGYLDGVIMQVFRGMTFRFMVNSADLNYIKQNRPEMPIGVAILLGLKEHHVYASGERIANQTQIALNSGKTPSYYYHEMIDIPIQGNTKESRLSWIKVIQSALSQLPSPVSNSTSDFFIFENL